MRNDFPLMLLAAAVSYLLSGYFGLYGGAQTIVYSKYKTQLENRLVE